jgi:hypothetical protein
MTLSRIDKSLGIYSILMGLAMITWWSILLTTGQMPELSTTPFTAVLHLTAEILTALSLLLGGVGILRSSWWAHDVSTLSPGMLLYAMVQASGYSADHGQTGLVLVFAVSALVVLYFASRVTARRRISS